MEYINRLLHRSTPTSKPSSSSILMSDNDNTTSKTAEHEVKVHFAREFADIESVTCPIPENLSSENSFHSSSSILSTKSNSNIYVDSGLDISDVANISYTNPDISGLEELIRKCGDICLESEQTSQDLTSQDRTFASAIEETSFSANDYSLYLSDVSNETSVIETNSQLHETAQPSSNQTDSFESINSTIKSFKSPILHPPVEEHLPQAEDIIEKSILIERTDNIVDDTEILNDINSVVENLLSPNNVNDNQLDFKTNVTSNNSNSNAITESEEQVVLNNCGIDIVSLENSDSYLIESSISSIPSVTQYAENQSLSNLFDVPSLLENIDNKAQESNVHDPLEPAIDPSFFDDNDQKLFILPAEIVNNSIVQSENSAVSSETPNCLSKEDVIIIRDEIQMTEGCNPSEIIITEKEEDIIGSVPSVSAIKEKDISNGDLECTLTLQEININLASGEEQYSEFKSQRQSTRLVLTQEEESDSKELQLTPEKVTNDLLISSPDLVDDTEQFVSATSEIFKDPSSFDFLLARSNTGHTNRLRAESLYIKFDPLVSNASMLPQVNSQSISEEQNGENKTPLPDVGTPKHNAALAAIDRLLFYSPLPSGTVQELEESQEKIDPEEKPKSDTSLNDINMTKELELVRDTVLQLEEELKKQKREHEVELEKQRTPLQEKINKLQTQITQEMKANTQMTVVMEEYEKSISRLSTERERDRTNFEQEKTKLQEELQAANHHLTNTEAAFNDVHQKYERLKGVVSVYKNNETILKESIQENVDTIKTLETRYDQLKNHAMTQLEKANLELDGIRKQNEAETVKLHAMIRKAELKSNSLAELVEQKTKENKELTKILDEVIARVGHNQE